MSKYGHIDTYKGYNIYNTPTTYVVCDEHGEHVFECKSGLPIVVDIIDSIVKDEWEILKTICDLPKAKELAHKITLFVYSHDAYNKAQIASIIDDFYGESCGMGIADDLDNILFKNK